jgi:hypothetical protein
LQQRETAQYFLINQTSKEFRQSQHPGVFDFQIHPPGGPNGLQEKGVCRQGIFLKNNREFADKGYFGWSNRDFLKMNKMRPLKIYFYYHPGGSRGPERLNQIPVFTGITMCRVSS